MAEFIPVTRTKIVVPRRRAELLSRTRLLELLDELLDNRLLIVAAPAGYGKTSLLVDFAYSSQWPFCWYALDNLDQDPQRFIAHFISAINLRFPNFGQSCMAALHSMSQDHLDVDVLVSLVINDAYENITEHFILVLDDFHLVEGSRAVVSFVNRFIQDVDENCHLILASRSLLTLPDLPLMVARSLVGGLSFEELCFQGEEIQRLLGQNYHLSLTESEAAELARETEGWVTGLLMSTQLMGKTIANRLRVAKVSGVGLYEYLAQQVLEQQEEAVQEFLLRSSLLDEFDQNLCEQVIGRTLEVQLDWREMIDAVMRLNLFVLPVGEEGVFLRYHHLFLDFLRDRIRRERPDEARLIQSRMAEIFTEREDWERAYQIYQAMGDPAAVVKLLEQAGSSLMIHGRLITLSDWLASLPEDLLRTTPTLLSLQGAVAYMRGDCNQGLKLLDLAVAGLRNTGSRAQLSQALYRRCVAQRFKGAYREALNDADEAILQASGESEHSLVLADARLGKGTVLSLMGQLLEALNVLKSALEIYQLLGDENTAAKVLMELGTVLKRLGNYKEAEAAYTRALDFYQATGNLVWQANLYNNLGVLQHTNGDFVTATSSFERAIHYAKVSGSPRLEAYALTSIGDLYQELDANQEALEAYRQGREVGQRVQDGYLLFYIDLVEARLRQNLNDSGRVRDLLQSSQAMAEERGSQYEQNLCLVEWGRYKLVEKQYKEALKDFRSALAFFTAENYQVEVPRAELYVMLASYLSAPEPIVAWPVEGIRAALQDPEKLKLLVAAGRETISYLEMIRDKTELGAVVSELLNQVDQHNQTIPSMRRLIRRHAGVVPFAPPKMIIRTLGKIVIKVSDHVITSSEWQVQTARDLFLLLLAHPEGLNKEQIGEIFWPDSTISELKLRFKNTIYRLRHAAGKDAIIFLGENQYLFNRQMDYEYDVESFQKEISLAEKAETPEKRAAHYKNALKYYRGAYLPDLDDSWVIIERERLFQIHMDALLRLAGDALSERKFDSAIDYCQRALKEDPCQEDAHRIAMRIYAAMGNRALVIRQYEQCRQALMEEVDAPPSYQTQALYESLIQ